MPGRQGRSPEAQQARALVAAGSQGGERQAEEGPQRALVAVTREIDNRLAIIGASSAAGIKPDRLKLVALTAFTRTPGLWTCDPVSVARSIVEAGQLGLEPTGLLGGAYLVPRGAQCTLLVGYRGLVMLALRSGQVQRVEARVVREKDQFDYGYGLEPYLHHVPSQEADPGAFTGAYAVIFYRDGSRQFDYMSKAEVEAVRKRSSAKDSGPWITDTAEMWKKTPLRRLMKLAPLTVEVAARLDELDPEVDTVAPSRPGAESARERELREQLQAALDREYGGGAPAAEQGQYRELPDDNAGGDAGQGAVGQEPEGASPASRGQQRARAPQEPASAAPPAAAGARQDVVQPGGPPTGPESVGQVLGTRPTEAEPVCGAFHEGLGVGPCALPADHQRVPYTYRGQSYPPDPHHEEAGGTRWTQPR